MAEKQGYREMLEFLSGKYPLLITRTQAAEILDVCPHTLRKIIHKNGWKTVNKKIPIGTIASFLCG